MTNLLCYFVIWFIFQILLQLKWNGLDDFRLGTRLQRYIFLYVHLINDHGFWIWTYYLSYLDRKVGSWHALFDCTNWFHFDLFWCGSKASKLELEILWIRIWIQEKLLKSISEVIFSFEKKGLRLIQSLISTSKV